MQDIFDRINEDDLTPDLKMISDACGLEAVRNMLRHLSGLSFYIPKITRLEGFVGNYMSAHKDFPLKKIAKDLGVSEQYLKTFSNKNVN